MNRKRILLTGVGEVLTESAEKRLEQGDSLARCDAGHTREFYEDLNVPENKMPKELLEREKQAVVGDEDYEEVHSEIMVYVDEIKLVVTDDEFTTVFLKDNFTVTVLETVEEIDFYLDFIERSEFAKLKDLLSMFFAKIFGRLKNK